MTFSLVENKNDIVCRKVTEAIDALVSGNEQKWQENIHPEQGKNIMDVETFKERLESKGIVLTSGNYTFGKYHIATTKNEAECYVKITQNVEYGTFIYQLTAEYLFSSNAEGFISFEINPLNSSSIPYYDNSAQPHTW